MLNCKGEFVKVSVYSPGQGGQAERPAADRRLWNVIDCEICAIENLSAAPGVTGSSHPQIGFLLYSEHLEKDCTKPSLFPSHLVVVVVFFTMGKWGKGMSIKQLFSSLPFKEHVGLNP